MNAPQDKTGGFSYLDDQPLEARFDVCTSVEGLACVLFAIVRGKLRKYRHPPTRVWVLPATEEEIDLSPDVPWPTLAEEADLMVTDMGFLPNGCWPPIKVGGRETVWGDPKLRKEAYGLAYVTALRLAHANLRLSRIPDQDVSSRRGLLSLVKWCIENMSVKSIEADLAQSDHNPNGPGQTGEIEGTKQSGSPGKTINIQNSTVIVADGNAAVNIDVRVEYTTYVANLRDAIEAEPKDSPTFAKVAKKTALDVIGSALKDVAKGQVKEAAKQIIGLGKDLGPVVINTAAYGFFKNCLCL